MRVLWSISIPISSLILSVIAFAGHSHLSSRSESTEVVSGVNARASTNSNLEKRAKTRIGKATFNCSGQLYIQEGIAKKATNACNAAQSPPTRQQAKPSRLNPFRSKNKSKTSLQPFPASAQMFPDQKNLVMLEIKISFFSRQRITQFKAFIANLRSGKFRDVAVIDEEKCQVLGIVRITKGSPDIFSKCIDSPGAANSGFPIPTRPEGAGTVAGNANNIANSGFPIPTRPEGAGTVPNPGTIPVNQFGTANGLPVPVAPAVAGVANNAANSGFLIPTRPEGAE